MRKILGVCFLIFAFAVRSHADSFAFATPGGSSTGGGPVSASAVLTTSAGQISITLMDLQANPTDIAQTISNLDFVLSSGITTGTLTSSSGQQITVNSNGTFTIGPTTSTGWGLNQNVNGGLQLDALGFVGPAGLIIGPPGGGGVYNNANGSIAGNAPHNPLINQTATFVISNASITSSTSVTSVTFSFGTTAGVNVAGVPDSTAVPEPTTLTLVAIGLLFLGVRARTRRRSASATG